MGITKKLATGTMIKAYSFDESNAQGQAIAVKNSNGDYQPVFYIESRTCAQGTIDRIEVKKRDLEELGFTVIITE